MPSATFLSCLRTAHPEIRATANPVTKQYETDH